MDGTEEKTGMFEEEPGQTSSMRVMAFLSLLAAIFAGYMEIKAAAPFPYVTTMFLGAAFGGKAAQKFAERK
jgi:hypothetical protein